MVYGMASEPSRTVRAFLIVSPAADPHPVRWTSSFVLAILAEPGGTRQQDDWHRGVLPVLGGDICLLSITNCFCYRNRD